MPQDKDGVQPSDTMDDTSLTHSEHEESSGQEGKYDQESKHSLNSQTDDREDEKGEDNKEQENETKSKEEQNENAEKQQQEDQETEDNVGESDQKNDPEQEEESASDKVLPPEQFDSKDFLASLGKLSEKLHADNLKHVDQEFPAEDLKLMVSSITSTLDNFRNYATHSQQQMENLREQMKTIKEKIYKTVQQKSYDPKSGAQRKSLEERQMDDKIAQLNKEVAKAAEEIVRASQITVQTEEAALDAALAAERAAEDARRIQEEYEARRRADEERRKAEEEARQMEEDRRKAEFEHQEEVRKTEEARKANLKRNDDKKSAEWETWNPATYNLDLSQDFDQGIGCIIRGAPQSFKESQIQIQAVDQTVTTFTCNENEEQVSNIIRLTPSESEHKLQKPIQVALPYCTSRITALTREPVVKAEFEEGTWTTLKSHEVSFDGHKDIKFAQAEVEAYGTVVVVTRNKLEYLHISKKGGRAVSSVDPRVTFTAEKGAFPVREHFVLQLEPVDTGTVSDIKKKFPEGSDLLSSSAIVNMEWTTKSFHMPVTMTLPCPPNPIKAKKAAAMRAAKEAKMRNPLPPGAMGEEERERKNRRKKHDLQRAIQEAAESTAPKTHATKWYMGQYGTDDEDEHDVLYMITKQANGRWYLVKHIDIMQLKLDLLQFNIQESLQKFVVIRTKTVLESKEVQKLAEIIETELQKKHVRVVVAQKKDNPTECTLHVVSPAKLEKLLIKLEEEGYEKGQGAISDVNLNEGDFLEVCFRGNIQCLKIDGKMELVFNSQLQQSVKFQIKEIDKFLQKSYRVYRGFVQLYKRIKLIRKPKKKKVPTATLR